MRILQHLLVLAEASGLTKEKQWKVMMSRIDNAGFHLTHGIAPSSRGYILQDGQILEFGGFDHRQVNALYIDDYEDGKGDIDPKVPSGYDEYSSNRYMFDFMARGNIRFHNARGELIMSSIGKISNAQKKVFLGREFKSVSWDKYNSTTWTLANSYRVDYFEFLELLG